MHGAFFEGQNAGEELAECIQDGKCNHDRQQHFKEVKNARPYPAVNVGESSVADVDKLSVADVDKPSVANVDKPSVADVDKSSVVDTIVLWCFWKPIAYPILLSSFFLWKFFNSLLST